MLLGVAVLENAVTVARADSRGRVSNVVTRPDRRAEALDVPAAWTELLDEVREALGGQPASRPRIVVAVGSGLSPALPDLIGVAALEAGADILAVQEAENGRSAADECCRAAAEARRLVQDRTRPLVPRWQVVACGIDRSSYLPAVERLRSAAVDALPEGFELVRDEVDEGSRQTAEQRFDAAAAMYRKRYRLVLLVRAVITLAVGLVEVGAVVLAPVAMIGVGVPGPVAWGAAAVSVLAVVVWFQVTPPAERTSRWTVSVAAAAVAISGYLAEPLLQIALPLLGTTGLLAPEVAMVHLLGAAGVLADVAHVLAFCGTGVLVSIQLSNVLRRHRGNATGYVLRWHRRCEIVCELTQVLQVLSDLRGRPEDVEGRRHIAGEKLVRLSRLHRLLARRTGTAEHRRHLREVGRSLQRLAGHVQDGTHRSGEPAAGELTRLLVVNLVIVDDALAAAPESARSARRRRVYRRAVWVGKVVMVVGVVVALVVGSRQLGIENAVLLTFVTTVLLSLGAVVIRELLPAVLDVRSLLGRSDPADPADPAGDAGPDETGRSLVSAPTRRRQVDG